LFNLSPDGYFGGAQIGYNWQAGNFVFGLETDIQGSARRDNKTCIATCSPVSPFATYDAKLPWFSTAPRPPWLNGGLYAVYANAGYAYGEVKTNITTPFGAGFYPLKHNRGGWTAGAGIETPFTLLGLLGSNWTSKAEYLYIDLGSTSNTVLLPAGGFATNTTRVQEHIFRTGINYHFNAPVVARY
jgi:outer membrane immunogenic protein